MLASVGPPSDARPSDARPSDDPPANDPPSDDPRSPDDEAALAFVLTPLVDDRSFLAQPEPLKWTVGVDMAFFIEPSAPQEGQNLGPASLMPWITSVRCRQFEQR